VPGSFTPTRYNGPVGRTRNVSLRVLELVVVAVVGAALALGGASMLGKLGNATTIQQIAPLGGSNLGSVALQPQAAHGLTAEQVYRRAAPGVVQVTADSPNGQALGSGFVIDKAGHIITNYHVVQGATRVRVSFSGQDQLPTKVIGTDPSTDIAVLKIQQHGSALTPLELGNSLAVRVGDTVFAIGNPFGYTRTLTSGLVSAVQREIKAPNTLPIENAIQTDAAINHGNSGGPLLDAAARVIGVTSQIYAGGAQQGNIGIGFAVPVNTVRNVAAQLIASGKVAHAFLGVSTLPVTKQLSRLFKLPASGLLVSTVDPGSGAAKAGIRAGKTNVVVGGFSYAIGGDVITAVDGSPVSQFEQLREAVAEKRPGDKVELQVFRDGSTKKITVTLGQAPNGRP
jgi:S1-C subfamily serine protease